MSGTEKSDGAFRTIREVADWLGVPTHVLRFWESKFEEIAPVKGAGGRRYYRPEDMRLLGGIKVLLHDQGLTIRGVSQRLDDDGVESVMALSPDLETVATARKTSIIRNEGAKGSAEVAGAKVVAFATAPQRVPDTPTIKDTPDNEEMEQPDPLPADTEPMQPVDTVEPSQPDDTDSPEQPDPKTFSEAAPDADPVAPATMERGVETPLPEATAARRTLRPTGSLTPQDHRKLRRIVRKLKILIEDVEEDLAQGGSR